MPSDASPVGYTLVRYNDDGSLDTSYGSGGRFESSFSAYPHSHVRSTTDAEGKLLLAAGYQPFDGGQINTGIIRFELGSVTSDATFGTNGFFSVENGQAVTKQIKVLSNGKILIAGGNTQIGGERSHILTRLTSSGAYDTSFNTTGQLLFTLAAPYTGANNHLSDAEVLPDGKIMVVGVAQHSGGQNYLFLGRLNDDGTWDSSFGTNGQIITSSFQIYSFPSITQKIFVQDDGKFLVSFIGLTGDGVARFNADGTLDTSFGSSGVSVVSGFSGAGDAIIDSNGDIIMSGTMIVGGKGYAAWVKFLK